MKTITIDGVEMELVERNVSFLHPGSTVYVVRLLPPKQKTLEEECTKEAASLGQKYLCYGETAICRVIDRRLAEICERIKKLEKGNE